MSGMPDSGERIAAPPDEHDVHVVLNREFHDIRSKEDVRAENDPLHLPRAPLCLLLSGSHHEALAALPESGTLGRDVQLHGRSTPHVLAFQSAIGYHEDPSRSIIDIFIAPVCGSRIFLYDQAAIA
jgi:hypothetical protein